MQSISWAIKRASVMQPRELIHRIGERIVLTKLRNAHRRGTAQLSMVDQPAAFRFCTATDAQLPQLNWEFHLAEHEIAYLMEGKWKALGYSWKWDPTIPTWNCSPDTGKVWPKTFFGAIPYQTGNSIGDVRVAWEPSRLQQLVSLALLARHKKANAGEAIKLLESMFASWVEANPPLTGIHYISSMECALRLIAACHAVDLVRTKLITPGRTWTNLLRLVGSHAPLIAKRLSLYSSAGNHTIAEGCGLTYAGTLFPEFPDATEWKAVGMRILLQEAKRQVLPDGGGIEQALAYHHFIIDLLRLVKVLLEHHGACVPTPITDAVQNGGAFLHAFAGHLKKLPQIGDDDNGHALSAHLRLNCERGEEQSTSSATFPNTGYTIVSRRSPLPFRLAFDHGPLGMPPCFGHGHADALSIIFDYGDQEVLIDPGTYTYICDAAWRSYFRGTQAHNTVLVDHIDQAVQETAFMWSKPFHVQLIHNSVDPSGAFALIARHDGYKERLGVIHWRGIAFNPRGGWLVWDYLLGTGSHSLELNWHLAIEPMRMMAGYAVQTDLGALHLHISGGATTVHRGETSPIGGWRSRIYGVREPISTLRTMFTGTLPHEFVTEITLENSRFAVPLSTAISSFRGVVHEATTH
jgi:hypothetical protein